MNTDNSFLFNSADVDTFPSLALSFDEFGPDIPSNDFLGLTSFSEETHKDDTHTHKRARVDADKENAHGMKRTRL